MSKIMDIHVEPATLAVGLAVALLAFYLVKTLTSSKKNLPPSPPGALPVVGHTLTMAKSKYPWRTFQ